MTTKRVHHESNVSPSSSITPPKKQKRDKEEREENHLGGLYWNRISQLSERANIRALSLNDLLERIHPIASIHFNYMIDTEWLISQYPSNCRHTPITLVVGERMGTDFANVKRHSARYSNVNIARAMIKIPFGTHHTKLSIFESDDNKIYVAVITANLIEGDWREKTQGFYLACGSLNGSSSSISSQFSADLCAYLQFYRDTGTPKDEWQLIEYWHDRLKNADFSTVTDRHRLVYSIPGYHQKSMMNEFGHLRLRKLLKDVEVNNCSFIAQCSSLGSLGAKPEAWLTGQFLESLAGGRRQGADKFRLIYPSINNVRMSFEGYQAGGSLPYQKATSNRQPWLIQFLHQWRSDKLERSRASPHIKTYTAISRETRKPNWLLLTSANVSKAAWGEIQKNNTQLMIRSYELGVLLLPGDEEQLELPYDYPLLKYGYCMPRDCRDEKVLNYLDDVLLFESDVALLKPGCWLNDQLITFALRYSLEQLPEDVRQKIAVLEPTVVEILKFGDFSLQQSIWSDLQLGNKELLLLAINDNPDPNTRNGAGSHWSLLVVRNHRNFEHLDSCGEFNVTVARQIAKSCSKNSQTAGQDHFLSVKVPKQANGSDCGLYLIEFTREYLQVGFIYGHMTALQSFTTGKQVNFDHLTPEFIAGRREFWLRLIHQLSITGD